MSAAIAATLATTIDAALHGQARAASILTAPKAGLPAATGTGLDRALAAIATEQQEASEAIEAAAPGMPAPIAELVGEVADRAVGQAAGMRGEGPSLPASAGGGAPGGCPSGPPSESPERGTPGRPTGIPFRP